MHKKGRQVSAGVMRSEKDTVRQCSHLNMEGISETKKKKKKKKSGEPLDARKTLKKRLFS